MKAHLLVAAALMGITLVAPRIAVGQGLTTRYVFAGPSTPASAAPPVAWGGPSAYRCQPLTSNLKPPTSNL
jgi:hypothetical protein